MARRRGLMPDPTEPETDPALTSLTCDWGGCEYTAKFWRFDPENGWLPVCFTEALVADWKAKTDAATQGPWEARTSEATMNDRSEWRIGRPDMPQVARSVMQAADAAFIAVSRTAVPRLLAAVASVLALHTERPLAPFSTAAMVGATSECRACSREWPCPTVRAINEALEGDTDAE